MRPVSILAALAATALLWAVFTLPTRAHDRLDCQDPGRFGGASQCVTCTLMPGDGAVPGWAAYVEVDLLHWGESWWHPLSIYGVGELGALPEVEIRILTEPGLHSRVWMRWRPLDADLLARGAAWRYHAQPVICSG